MLGSWLLLLLQNAGYDRGSHKYAHWRSRFFSNNNRLVGGKGKISSSYLKEVKTRCTTILISIQSKNQNTNSLYTYLCFIKMKFTRTEKRDLPTCWMLVLMVVEVMVLLLQLVMLVVDGEGTDI